MTIAYSYNRRPTQCTKQSNSNILENIRNKINNLYLLSCCYFNNIQINNAVFIKILMQSNILFTQINIICIHLKSLTCCDNSEYRFGISICLGGRQKYLFCCAALFNIPCSKYLLILNGIFECNKEMEFVNYRIKLKVNNIFYSQESGSDLQTRVVGS